MRREVARRGSQERDKICSREKRHCAVTNANIISVVRIEYDGVFPARETCTTYKYIYNLYETAFGGYPRCDVKIHRRNKRWLAGEIYRGIFLLPLHRFFLDFDNFVPFAARDVCALLQGAHIFGCAETRGGKGGG